MKTCSTVLILETILHILQKPIGSDFGRVVASNSKLSKGHRNLAECCSDNSSDNTNA